MKNTRPDDEIKESKIDLESEQRLKAFYNSITLVDSKGNILPDILTDDTSDDPENDRAGE